MHSNVFSRLNQTLYVLPADCRKMIECKVFHVFILLFLQGELLGLEKYGALCDCLNLVLGKVLYIIAKNIIIIITNLFYLDFNT